jgi:Uma2 family endonuclease
MAVQPKRMTLEEFMDLPDDGNRHELVRGELRVMPPSKGEHGFVEVALLAAIDRYLYDRAGALGWEPRQGIGARNALVGRIGGGELGLHFAVPDDPHMVRGADGAYIPPEQLARVAWDGRGYFPEVPALVIEIISESDKASDVNEKVHDYLAGGARRVWCIYPEQRTVHIHHPTAAARVVRGKAILTDDELLPGFALPLNLIFAGP